MFDRSPRGRGRRSDGRQIRTTSGQLSARKSDSRRGGAISAPARLPLRSAQPDINLAYKSTYVAEWLVKRRPLAAVNHGTVLAPNLLHPQVVAARAPGSAIDALLVGDRDRGYSMSRVGRVRCLLGLVALACFTSASWLTWDVGTAASAPPHEVPTLTGWAKIYSFALLAALGVAVLVWRRPVVQAQAVLETSPLGLNRPVSLPDWRGYAVTLVLVETLAFAGVVVFDDLWAARPAADWLGLAGCAAVVAFVMHLLWRQVHAYPKGGGRSG